MPLVRPSSGLWRQGRTTAECWPSFIAFRKLFPLRMPIQNQRDWRGRTFVRGEIDQESLAVGGHGVLLPDGARQGTAGNANREEGRRRFGFQRLAIGRHLHRGG